ncbi:GH23870 [Drosophila grimshawi]|uniref:GH14671 n=1 Tax=Drosophila grimshawi TaxID=7222 RepID=B4IXN0_DROGR|nr:GH14671 [Drosophila grimshawi]EDW04639.1 GH23870 [Drosophila grimshawi]
MPSESKSGTKSRVWMRRPTSNAANDVGPTTEQTQHQHQQLQQEHEREQLLLLLLLLQLEYQTEQPTRCQWTLPTGKLIP